VTRPGCSVAHWSFGSGRDVESGGDYSVRAPGSAQRQGSPLTCCTSVWFAEACHCWQEAIILILSCTDFQGTDPRRGGVRVRGSGSSRAMFLAGWDVSSAMSRDTGAAGSAPGDS